MASLLTRLFPLALLLTLAAGQTIPTGWIYEGCLYDNSANRALNKTFYALNTMTNEICRSYCGSYGFKYAGMEVGFQCFCGSSFLYYTVQSESNCNTACYGDSTELCGGSGYMTLFMLTSNDPVTGAATAGTTSTTSAAAAAAASSSPSDTAATASSSTALTAGATTSGVSSSGGTQPTSSIQSVTASSGSVASSITQSGSGTTATNSTSVSFGVLSASSGTAASSTSGTTGKVVMPTTNVSGIITAGKVAGTPRFRDGSQAVVFGKIVSGAKRLRDIGSLFAVTVPVAIGMLWGFTLHL